MMLTYASPPVRGVRWIEPENGLVRDEVDTVFSSPSTAVHVAAAMPRSPCHGNACNSFAVHTTGGSTEEDGSRGRVTCGLDESGVTKQFDCAPAEPMLHAAYPSERVYSLDRVYEQRYRYNNPRTMPQTERSSAGERVSHSETRRRLPPGEPARFAGISYYVLPIRFFFFFLHFRLASCFLFNSRLNLSSGSSSIPFSAR